MILEEAARSSRYSALEIAALQFEGEAPDAALLSRKWRAMLRRAHDVVALLPTEHVGECVLNRSGKLFSGDALALESALSRGEVRFHSGTIGGVWPRFK